MITMNFCGKNSLDFGIGIKSHRQMLPPLRPRLLEVDGMDGAYDFEENTYGMRTVIVDCYIHRIGFMELRRKARELSAWLSGKGRLSFSDEPNLYYVGRCYNAVSLEQDIIASGKFVIEFSVNPIAYGATIEVNAEFSNANEVSVPITYGGTFKTGCRIIIKNTGSTTINAIQLLHEMRSES